MDEGAALAHTAAVREMIREWLKTASRDSQRARTAQLDELIQKELIVSRRIAQTFGRSGVVKGLNRMEQPFAHEWFVAANALVELEGLLEADAKAAAILGPAGPRLAAAALHPLIWDAAADLWAKGFPRQALQTAAQALEGFLRGKVERPDISGSKLATAFAIEDPTEAWLRLRIPGFEDGTDAWKSAHTGAGALVRGAFDYVRNLASHPGSPDPSDDEALEQLAVLSLVARIVERCDVQRFGDDAAPVGGPVPRSGGGEHVTQRDER